MHPVEPATRDSLRVVVVFLLGLCGLFALGAGSVAAWQAITDPPSGQRAPSLVRVPVVARRLVDGGTARTQIILSMESDALADQVTPLAPVLQSTVGHTLAAQSARQLVGPGNMERFRAQVEADLDAALEGRKLPPTERVYIESLIVTR